MMLNNSLVQDVIMEILSRLPAKSLIRFKCVDKSRYALIESSEFVAMQLRNHVSSSSLKKEKEEEFLLTSYRGGGRYIDGCQKVWLSLLRYDGEVVSFVGKDVNIAIMEDLHPLFMISSQCDGIVCLHNFTCDVNDRVIIANLGIRQFRALPESCIPFPVVDPIYNEDGSIYCVGYSRLTVALGLGFDLKSNNYKVVRIFKTWDSSCDKFEVEVYSLSSNSWRQIEDLNVDNITEFFNPMSSSLCNGSYYWPVIKEDGYWVTALCAFDFSNEIFQCLGVPECVSDLYDGIDHPEFDIIEFNEALSLYLPVSYGANGEWKECVEIWVMNELGVSETWTKAVSIEAPTWKHLGFLGKDQLLVLSEGLFASYNLVTHETKILSSTPIDRGSDYFRVVSYRTSLLSIDR